jgi:hypothetical protein
MSLFILSLMLSASGLAPDERTVAEDNPHQAKTNYTTISVRGHIVWLSDEMAEDGIELAAEVKPGNLMLKDGSGKLLPLLEDRRGHAFRLDPRLRANKVELLVRQSDRHPYLQVLKVYELDKTDRKRELVYWCDVCAITMFELKPCDCCQGKIELQRREVKQ